MKKIWYKVGVGGLPGLRDKSDSHTHSGLQDSLWHKHDGQYCDNLCPIAALWPLITAA